MKRYVLAALMVIFLLPSVFSLDCEYTEERDFERYVNVFYENGEEMDEPLLYQSGFRIWKERLGYTLTYEFLVNNMDTNFVNATIIYIKDGYQVSGNYLIAPQGFVRIASTYQQDNSGPDNETIQIIIENNSKYTSAWEKRTFTETICKECPSGSGIKCKENGESCTDGSECGSTVCNTAGICSEVPWVIGDEVCDTTNTEENCVNSPLDCHCPYNTYCNENVSRCVADPTNKMEGWEVCGYEFVKAHTRPIDESCNCDIECGEGYVCDDGLCSVDCINPPTGMLCCQGDYARIDGSNLGQSCGCQFECADGICYHSICRQLANMSITCSELHVYAGDEVACSIIVKEIIDNVRPIVIDIDVNSGAELRSSGLLDCSGTHCSYEGTPSGLQEGDSGFFVHTQDAEYIQFYGTMEYEEASERLVNNIRSDIALTPSFCGDGRLDPEETVASCCMDAEIPAYSLFSASTESCENNLYAKTLNYPLLLAIIIFLLLVGIAIYVLKQHFDDKKRKRAIERIEREIHSSQMRIEEIRMEMDNSQQALAKLNAGIARRSASLQNIESKMKNAKQELREKLEKEYEKESKLLEEKKTALRTRKKALESEELEMQRQKEIFEKNNNMLRINRALDKYSTRYHSLKYDPESGYLIFKNGERLHRHRYKKYFKDDPTFSLKNGEVIHHIDTDKLNNELWNLIALPRHTHGLGDGESFNHGKIDGFDWKEGISQLKRQLGLTENDFHKEIMKRLRDMKKGERK